MAALGLGSADIATRSSFLASGKILQSGQGSSGVSSSCQVRVSGAGFDSQGGIADLSLPRASSRSEFQRPPLALQWGFRSVCSSAALRGNLVAAQAQAASTDTVNVPLESEAGVSYETLRDRLAAGQWEEADNETRRLLCVLAGEGAAKRKWVYFSEVQFIPSTDLLTIDALWRAYSNNRFGYSVQRRMWQADQRRWKPFFLKIGWTYGENSTYKKFPLEFTWDLEAPIGHLPLTNALRGTQLIEKVLSHPAFAIFDKETEMLESSNEIPSFTGIQTAEPVQSAVTSSAADKPAQENQEGNVLDDGFDSSQYGF